MPRVQEIRSEVKRLIREVPFHPFALNMENGDRIVIDHPENIAFNPKDATNGKVYDAFYVISDSLRYSSTFEAVTGVAVIDRGENAA
jgi:hypothetical protein